MIIRKGEHVLHAQHGVGKIKSIRNRSFSGHAPASYVQLYFERDELTMTVLEKDLPGVVRGLISSEEAQELLDQISAWNGKPKDKWKSRANAHQAAIESGNPFEYVKVVKELTYLERQDELRLRDREHLSKSLCLITDELAFALKKSPRNVRMLLSKATGSSL